MLPPGATVVGIDERTALALDLRAGCGHVLGNDGVTVLHAGSEQRFKAGTSFPLSLLGSFQMPEPAAGIPHPIWQEAIRAVDAAATQSKVEPPPEVLSLVEAREAARARKDWQAADDLRDQIASQGWQIQDTRQGPDLAPATERTR
jgi:hypothetical protein